MGAGILPATILRGKLHFLFGKENQYEDSAHGFSDFGGGTDSSESFLDTAIREAGEEFTGFLGSDADVRSLLTRHGTVTIDYKSPQFSVYRMHIFPFPYNPFLAMYYNNNQRFLQKHLDPKVIQRTKIFEKEEIRWVCVDELLRMKKQFRSYFQNIVELILARRDEIETFVRRALRKQQHRSVRRPSFRQPRTTRRHRKRKTRHSAKAT